MKKIFLLITIFLLLSKSVFADVAPIINPSDILIDNSDPSSILAKIISYGIGIASILGVISLTWGGIQMIIAAGDDEKIKKARYMIIYSIIGVLVAGLAYGIVKVVTSIQI